MAVAGTVAIETTIAVQSVYSRSKNRSVTPQAADLRPGKTPAWAAATLRNAFISSRGPPSDSLTLRSRREVGRDILRCPKILAGFRALTGMSPSPVCTLHDACAGRCRAPGASSFRPPTGARGCCRLDQVDPDTVAPNAQPRATGRSWMFPGAPSTPGTSRAQAFPVLGVILSSPLRSTELRAALTTLNWLNRSRSTFSRESIASMFSVMVVCSVRSGNAILRFANRSTPR